MLFQWILLLNNKLLILDDDDSGDAIIHRLELFSFDVIRCDD